jgi:hypothetical protein
MKKINVVLMVVFVVGGFLAALFTFASPVRAETLDNPCRKGGDEKACSAKLQSQGHNREQAEKLAKAYCQPKEPTKAHTAVPTVPAVVPTVPATCIPTHQVTSVPTQGSTVTVATPTKGSGLQINIWLVVTCDAKTAKARIYPRYAPLQDGGGPAVKYFGQILKNGQRPLIFPGWGNSLLVDMTSEKQHILLRADWGTGLEADGYVPSVEDCAKAQSNGGAGIPLAYAGGAGLLLAVMAGAIVIRRKTAFKVTNR